MCDLRDDCPRRSRGCLPLAEAGKVCVQGCRVLTEGNEVVRPSPYAPGQCVDHKCHQGEIFFVLDDDSNSAFQLRLRCLHAIT